MTAIYFPLAAALELLGCYAVWAWWRGEVSALCLLPGAVALAGFAWLLALTPPAFAGRSFAVYGGVYVAAALGWMWLVDGVAPDRADMIGGALVLLGAGVMLWGRG